jgi:hypothetical protein
VLNGSQSLAYGLGARLLYRLLSVFHPWAKSGKGLNFGKTVISA